MLKILDKSEIRYINKGIQLEQFINQQRAAKKQLTVENNFPIQRGQYEVSFNISTVNTFENVKNEIYNLQIRIEQFIYQTKKDKIVSINWN